jgi:hypothetical protein
MQRFTFHLLWTCLPQAALLGPAAARVSTVLHNGEDGLLVLKDSPDSVTVVSCPRKDTVVVADETRDKGVTVTGTVVKPPQNTPPVRRTPVAASEVPDWPTVTDSTQQQPSGHGPFSVNAPVHWFCA